MRVPGSTDAEYIQKLEHHITSLERRQLTLIDQECEQIEIVYNLSAILLALSQHTTCMKSNYYTMKIMNQLSKTTALNGLNDFQKMVLTDAYAAFQSQLAKNG